MRPYQPMLLPSLLLFPDAVCVHVYVRPFLMRLVLFSGGMIENQFLGQDGLGPEPCPAAWDIEDGSSSLVNLREIYAHAPCLFSLRQLNLKGKH